MHIEIANCVIALFEQSARAQTLLSGHHDALLFEIFLLAGCLAPVLPLGELGHRSVGPLNAASMLESEEYALFKPGLGDYVTQPIVTIHEGLLARVAEPHDKCALHATFFGSVASQADERLLSKSQLHGVAPLADVASEPSLLESINHARKNFRTFHLAPELVPPIEIG